MPKKIRPIRVEGNIAYVPLTQGYEAVIDAEDLHLAAGLNWYAAVTLRSDKTIRAVYAFGSARFGAKQKTILLHRIIAGTPEGLETDHIDGDGLNNRRSNLRNAMVCQNRRNRRVGVDNTSGVKGVSWHKKCGRWRADIMLDGKKHYLGLFDAIDAAAKAYAAASAEFHDAFGRT